MGRNSPVNTNVSRSVRYGTSILELTSRVSDKEHLDGWGDGFRIDARRYQHSKFGDP